MFYICAAFYLFGCLCYFFLISGEVQSWAMDKTVFVVEVNADPEKKQPSNTAGQEAEIKSTCTETKQAYVNPSFEKTEL